jgi:hypothetical protein
MDTGSRTATLGWMVGLVTLASAACALVSMAIVGQRQRSVLLIALFTMWVLLPYAAFALANARARAWRPAARRTVQYATIVVALAAMGRYLAVVLWPLKVRPASTFLIVPFVSCLVFATIVAFASRTSRDP